MRQKIGRKVHYLSFMFARELSSPITSHANVFYRVYVRRALREGLLAPSLVISEAVIGGKSIVSLLLRAVKVDYYQSLSILSRRYFAVAVTRNE